MNPMMIAGAAAAVGFALAGLQTWRLGNAQETIGELKAKFETQIAQTRQVHVMNQSLNDNVDELVAKIADMVEGRRLEREERDRLLAARDEDIAAETARARRLEGERDEIFRRNIGCAEMGDIRVDLVCPAIATQLRERTGQRAGGGDSEDSRGAGGGSETPASAAHTPSGVPLAAG